MNDVFVRVIDLPYCIKGITVPDEEGDFNVYINSRLSYDEQKITYIHEHFHILHKHFDTFDDIIEKEFKAKVFSYNY